MSVEKRRGTSNMYFYEVTRAGGQLNKQYVGPLSNPIVKYIHDLQVYRKAVDRHRYQAQQQERRELLTRERTQCRPTAWAADWPALRFLISHQGYKPMNDTQEPEDTDLHLPSLATLQRACRQAEAGDEEAQAQVSHWLQQAPAVLDYGMHYLQLGREQLVRPYADAGAEVQAGLRAILDTEIAHVARLLPSDDPLARACGETFVLAKMHVLQCQLKLLDSETQRTTTKHYEELTDRAHRRYQRVLDAYTRQLESKHKAS